MNPHTTTPPRPSSLQWKVGKKSPLWTVPTVLAIMVIAVSFMVLLSIVCVQNVATRRAVRACDAGHLTCRVSMGYTRDHVLAEDAAEDQTVCGDGWRACIDASSEGNIQ